ncbi:MAG: phosphoglycerate kinase [Candidatus Paracaedibacteraceae bacterium]|nr:phosphoglycerate kinase [Candidatus Paracaedibacteraceae bacterium]
MNQLPLLDQVDITNKTVLVRLDLNLPFQDQQVSDDTRIRRSLKTLTYLIDHQCKVIILSHRGRPKGAPNTSLSLEPIAHVLKNYIDCPISFAADCIGTLASSAIQAAPHGSIILLENLRFHPEEEKNDLTFAKRLASLGDIYVNDAFSCSHRAHASVVALAQLLPAVAGFGMQEELTALNGVLSTPERPLMAIVGGSKVSTKLDLLNNLITKVDYLVLGGGMANTFLLAQGQGIGASLAEPDLAEIALALLEQAKNQNCTIILPTDFQSPPDSFKIMDIGAQTAQRVKTALDQCKTLVWNGPVGVFEIPPYDQGSIAIARHVAQLTNNRKLISVAGGGDTLACLKKAGAEEQFTYTSTAGGAFLEWLEGKKLPGITVLSKDQE